MRKVGDHDLSAVRAPIVDHAIKHLEQGPGGRPMNATIDALVPDLSDAERFVIWSIWGEDDDPRDPNPLRLLSGEYRADQLEPLRDIDVRALGREVRDGTLNRWLRQCDRLVADARSAIEKAEFLTGAEHRAVIEGGRLVGTKPC